MAHTEQKKVAVFVTGGTIVCSYDTQRGVLRPALTGRELLEALPALDGDYDVELVEFCSLPGPHLTPTLGLELARSVQETLCREDVLGAVVVQGTDTLEEIAYLFHLTVHSEKPVVFTGSMKSPQEPYTDAQGNLWGAIRLAACPEAWDHGVMIYFNQEIIPACYAIKDDANNMHAFRAVGTGPMGSINGAEIVFFYKPERDEQFQVERLDCDVQLIKAASGMDSFLLDTCVQRGVDGLVLEGMGAGNLPPAMVAGIRHALERHIPVVMVSRCTEGFATGTYDYEGGGAQLGEMGVVFGGDLNGQKARIRLMVLCSMHRDFDLIAAGFSRQPVRRRYIHA